MTSAMASSSVVTTSRIDSDDDRRRVEGDLDLQAGREALRQPVERRRCTSLIHLQRVGGRQLQ